MTTALLRKTKLEEWQRLQAPVQQAEAVLRTSAVEQLKHVAVFVETASRRGQTALNQPSRHGI